MPSLYLQGADVTTYGVPNATAPQILLASSIIDAFLNKPEGLLYNVDGSNNPITMQNSGKPISLYTESGLHDRIVLSYSPVVALLSVQFNDLNLPLEWKAIDGSGFTPDGDVFLGFSTPINSDLWIQYIAGWQYADLPSAIKQACANIINMNTSSSANNKSGPVTRYKAGGTQVDFAKPFNDVSTLLYSDVATINMLAPYRRVFA